MKKKFIVFALSVLLAFQNVSMAAPVYASEGAEIATYSESNYADTKESKKIYLTNGEGTLGAGKGTSSSPYQNIRTALANVQDGDTLILVGDVVYTEYEKDSDGGALPLYINQNITIQGQDLNSGLLLRSTIQLGADVTFRGMNLEIVPQISLEGTNGSSTGSLGVKIERSNTIFTAGYNLTLDNVDTQVGTSLDQYKDRPYISCGTYKGMGEVGEKSVITILNPNGETMLGGIYAGDYVVDRTMDVEINLDGKLVDTIIHTGGYNGTLNGDVQINISGKSNVSAFDQKNHNGAVNVTLKDKYQTTILSVDGIDSLHLTEGTKVMPPSNGQFRVKDVVVDKDATLDLRTMKAQPVVEGNFVGTNTTDASLTGHVLVNNDQTLTIGGQVTGLTRLNARSQEYIQYFRKDHVYVTALATSSGDFTIEGTIYTECELSKTTEKSVTSWTIMRKEVEEGLKFHSFEWAGGEDKIVKPAYKEEFIYPITFYNRNNDEYRPSMMEILYDYEYALVRADGKELDTDWEVFIDWYLYENEDDVTDRNGVLLIFYAPEKEYGELILKVTHVESGKSLERRILVMQNEVESSEPTPSEAPSVSPSEVPSEVPSEAPSVSPSESPSATPTITLNKTNATLYVTGDSSTLQLKATIVGDSKDIIYSSSKRNVAQVSKSGKITAKAPGTTIIKAEANGVTATCRVTVKKTSLKLNKTKATLYTKGSTTLQLRATTEGASKKVEYSSSRKSVAIVDKNGKVTVKRTGTTVITAKANGLTARCTITVKKPTLSVGKTKVYVKKGKTIQLDVKATPVNKITFTSSKKRYASVTSNGKVKGIKPGTSVITVRCNGITKKITVIVKK